MATPRKSTSSIPPTPRRPYTPESSVGRSPRASGPPSSPDRRYFNSPDQPTKSYLRPTVSSSLHQGNTSSPRRSIDKPPFLPPSSRGINSIHHKNPSTSHKGTLSLKSIFTKANNALKVGRKSASSTGSYGYGFSTGSTSSTPVRPRSPAVVKKKEGNKSYARSFSDVPKTLEVTSTRYEVEETETVSTRSIDQDRLREQLQNLLEPAPTRVSEITVESSPPPELEAQESVQNEDVVNQEVTELESSVEVIEEKPVEKKQEDITKVEEIEEISMENVKVIEECREVLPKVEEEVEDTVVVEAQEEEVVPEVEDVEVVKDMNQENENNNVVVEEEIKEPEVMVVTNEEEIKIEEEIKEESEEKEREIEIEEGEKQDTIEEETPAIESEINVENAVIEESPKEEDKPSISEILVAEETPKREEKPTTIVEAPKVLEKKWMRNISERKPEARKDGGISNDVIEETRTKLLEKKKSKVSALVGAFETVMQ